MRARLVGWSMVVAVAWLVLLPSVSAAAPVHLTRTGRVANAQQFPVNVWLQEPLTRADDYRRVGVNSFMGLWNGATPDRLAAIREAGMTTMPEFSNRALSSTDAAAISAWLQMDEPDNAQPLAGGGWGSCVLPATIEARYRRLKTADPTRPVVLNLGQGVANPDWVGRGDACSGHDEHYAQYARGADVLSFDVYPVNNHLPLKLVARGVDNLRRWGGGKPVWAFVETTAYNAGNGRPTARQIRAEAWMAVVHGASGISFFCHVFDPDFIEAGCLDPRLGNGRAIAQVTRELRQHAAALNARSRGGELNRSGVDWTIRRRGATVQLFAVEMDGRARRQRFTVPGISTGRVEVVGERRSIRLRRGTFSDSFAGWGVHRYIVSR